MRSSASCVGDGLPEVRNVHAVELGPCRNQVVLVENAHADEDIAEVGPGGGIGRESVLDLCFGREVALQENLLESKGCPPVGLWRGAVNGRSVLSSGSDCLLGRIAVPALTPSTQRHDPDQSPWRIPEGKDGPIGAGRHLQSRATANRSQKVSVANSA